MAIARNVNKKHATKQIDRLLSNPGFGYGLHKTHIKSPERRDRLFLLIAICYMLLIILGQAGENVGLDYMLKVNTVKTRTHSLFT